MDIGFSEDAVEAVSCDLLAVGVGPDFLDELAHLNGVLGGTLCEWLQHRGFEGKSGDAFVMPTLGKVAAESLAIVGIGAGESSAVLDACGLVGKMAREHRASRVAIALSHSAISIEAIVAFVSIGNYSYDTYRPERFIKPSITHLTLLSRESSADNDRAARRGLTQATYQALARDLVNMPAADMYPQTLAETARKLESLDHVDVEVWDIERCRKEGCVGIVAVGQGSVNPGVLIHIRYRPPNAHSHVALVGKGVTFDAGGLSLKPTSGMLTMRSDMGGAATALATAGAAADLGVPVAMDVFLPAVENMADGNSYKLGDVLTYNNGVTVEVHNTDAEGRLVLADGLIQACQIEGVTHVIDIATLTGAVIVAIGTDFTGVFTEHDDFATDLMAGSNTASERVWRLPLHTPYKRLLKGEWGQIKNVGGREAGATTAALFLSHFVTDEVKWAHLDIAGAAFQDKPRGIWAAGGTGCMVRSLVAWLEDLA